MTANEFKEVRKMLDYSQAKMASALGGYSIRAVQSWEAGQRKIPPAVAKLIHILVTTKE